MTRKLTSSRTVRWVGAVSVVFSIATAAVVLRGQEEDINPIGILFRRRDAKNAKTEEKPPQAPSDVPKAPPAQNMRVAQAPAAAEQTDPLLKHVDEALRLSGRRFLVAESANGKPNSPWQIMHGVLALRNEMQVRTNRGVVNAIEWISRDPVFRGDHWFEATRFGGRGHPFSVPYHFEGHVNQFLALLTMSNLPLDHKIGVEKGKFVTMADMVRHAQMTVNANEEISWTLWFLTHYLEPDATWVNFNGERWGMEKLLKIQTADEVTTAPCGGTHGLFAMSYARNSYLQKHKKLAGTWIEVDQKIQMHIAKARSMRNKDGSFSSHFFRETGHTEDPTDRLKSSGHMLEWLMMAVPQEELKQDWIRYGVFRVAADLVQFSNQEIDPGPLYHAVHAITLYRERVMPKALTPQNAKPLNPQLAEQKKPITEPAVPPMRQAPPPAGVAPKSLAASPPNPPAPRALPTIDLNAPAAEKKVATAPPGVPPETAPLGTSPKAPSAITPQPGIALQIPKSVPAPTDAAPVPMPEKPAVTAAPMEIKPLAPAVVGTPGSNTLELPPLPSLVAPVEPKRLPSAVPFKEPIGVAATPPNPTPLDVPVQVAEVPKENLPAPPLFEMKRRGRGDGKPDGAAGIAPKPTTVTAATPIVLPPLPLDAIDQPEKDAAK